MALDMGLLAARSGAEGPYAARLTAGLSNVGDSSQEATNQSVGTQSGSQQSSGSSQSSSTSFIPDYSQTPILEGIANYAMSMAPQVYQHGMDQWTQNQGDIDQLMKTAQSYASGSRLNADVGMAEAGQQQAGEAALRNSKQDLESYGIDPSSGRYAALDSAAKIQTAANAAGAGNQQYRSDIATGNAMQNQAISSELQNSAYGNQVADTMNNLLGTGMQLKYSPLGTTSESSSTNESSGTSSGSTVSSGQSSGQNDSLGFGGGGGSGGDNGVALPGSLNYEKLNEERSTFGQPGYFGARNAQPTFAHGGPIGTPTTKSYEDGSDLTQGYDPDQDGPAVHDGQSPSGGQAIDDVPAKLTAGEFVLPNDVVKWKGEEFFQNLISKSRQMRQSVMAAHGQDQQGQQQPQMRRGGAITHRDDSMGFNEDRRAFSTQPQPGDNIYAQSHPGYDSGQEPVTMNMGGAI